MADLNKRMLDHYRLTASVGAGSMGAVYRAIDERRKRTVAIKIIKPTFAQNEAFRGQFFRDMRLLAPLEHPNLVRIYEPGYDKDQLYLATEWVEGLNLIDYLAQFEKPFLDLSDALRYASKLADALHYLHDQGIEHLAVKPSNIHMRQRADGSWQPLFSDVGLKSLVMSARNSEVATIESEYDYLAPELFMSGVGDTLSDIYAMGVVLYRMTAGTTPFEIKTLEDVNRVHKDERALVPLPTIKRPGLPPQLEDILLTALARDPAQRYQTAAELARVLAELVILLDHQEATFLNPSQQDPDLTLLQQETLRSMGQYTQPEIPPELIDDDHIVIFTQQPPTRTIKIDQDVMMIGRDITADIQVDDPTLSRFQARLERQITAGGEASYYIIDLGSTNGTWLEGSRLTSGQPALWEPGKRLKLGAAQLILIGRAGLQPTLLGSYNYKTVPVQVTEAVSDPVQMVPLEIDALIAPERIVIKPGEVETVNLTIQNQQLVDRFQITVEDTMPHGRTGPADWVILPDTQIELLPGANQVIPLVFQPPMESQSQAELYSFVVVIDSIGRPNASDMRLAGQLEILPYYTSESDLHPTRTRGDKPPVLTLTNTGNVAQQYTLEARDEENALEIYFNPPTVRLTPGETAEIALTLRPYRRRPFFGIEARYPFSVAVTTTQMDVAPLQHNGELVLRPVIGPQFVPVFFILLSLCAALTICSGVALATISSNSTANIQGTQSAETEQAVTQTFMETQQAEQSDTDRDGLTNAEEAELGTDPNNPDTDSDTLNDGDEVKIFNTNPLDRDSDNDELDDALEISTCSNESNPDSDGDGQPDGFDPAPCLAPTLEPTPIPPPQG